MNKTLLFLIAFFLFYVPSGFCCEPCKEILGFQSTVQQADLIIVGRKIAEDTPAREQSNSGPESITIQVLKYLKGKAPRKIKVNSWDGMCPFGIVIDNRTYVIFLQKKGTPLFALGKVEYDAINQGCSIKTYPVESDTVYFEDQKISLDIFKLLLK